MTIQKIAHIIKRVNRDLTEGKPFKVIAFFALPMLLSVAFQQMYNIVDSVVAGQFIGKNALAAVGASYPVTMLFMAFALGFGIGINVIVSQLFGLKQYGRLKTAVCTSTVSVIVLAAVLTVAGTFVCEPILKLLDTPQEIIDDAIKYMLIYVWGLEFLFVYNSVNSISTAMGDSRTPLYMLIFSSLLNIALDIVFVTAFKMGVAGVAWATFIAQGLAAVLASLILLLRLRKLEGNFKMFDRRLFVNIIGVAIPSVLQQSFVSVGNLFVQSVVNRYGPDVVAGYSASLKVSLFAVSCFTTVGTAVSSYTGQNLGAGRTERVSPGVKSALTLGFITAAIFIAAYSSVGNYITRLFVNGEDSAKVIETGQIFLWCVSAGYPFVMAKVILDGVLRGAGDMTSFMITTFSDLIIRVALSFALAPALGFLAVGLAYPIGWLPGMLLSLFFFKRGRWKGKLGVDRNADV